MVSIQITLDSSRARRVAISSHPENPTDEEIELAEVFHVAFLAIREELAAWQLPQHPMVPRAELEARWRELLRQYRPPHRRDS